MTAPLSLMVIIADAAKPVANGAIEAMGWHPAGGDSFYLGASPTGEAPATHWFMRTQARQENADLLAAIASGTWPKAPPEWLTQAATWDAVGLTDEARAALTAATLVDVRTVYEIDRDYVGHVASALRAHGLRRVTPV